MGLFDKVTQGLQNQLGGDGAEAPSFLGDALSNLGGAEGLAGMLDQAGLGDRVQSWLGTASENLPISAEELQSAIGEERLGELAEKIGVPQDAVANLLSQQLPDAIDQASPEGVLDQAKE